MTFVPKAWGNFFAGGTKVDAAALIDLETRLSTYTDQVAASAVLSATTQVADYTIALADSGTVVEMTSTTGANLTIPPNSSVAFPIGTVLEILQYGSGQVTFVAGSGVVLRTPSTLTTRAQFSAVALRKRAADEWILGGDLS